MKNMQNITDQWAASDDSIIIAYEGTATFTKLEADEGGGFCAHTFAMPIWVEIYTGGPEDESHWTMHQDRFNSFQFPTGTAPTELQRNWVLGVAWYWLNHTAEGRSEILKRAE